MPNFIEIFTFLGIAALYGLITAAIVVGEDRGTLRDWAIGTAFWGTIFLVFFV